MKIEELDEEMKKANEIILNWKDHNNDLNDLYIAVHEAFEANREAIINYLKEQEN